MLDPVQNHALRLCVGAYRTSPSSSLCVLANEPPLYIRRRKLSIQQYCLKLSSSPQNPTYNTVFNCKFTDLFERKPNQIPPLRIRVQLDMRAIDFVKRNALIYWIPATPPWLLKRPHVNYDIHRSFKDNTSPEIYRNKFFEFCDHYKDFYLFNIKAKGHEGHLHCSTQYKFKLAWLDLRVGGHPALSLHSSNEPGELSKWPWSWSQHHCRCRWIIIIFVTLGACCFSSWHTLTT